MRIINPLNAESTESTIQSRMFHPVLSIAITQRLRYLSYWCWLTEQADSIRDDTRALYEKVMLLGSAPHDCPDEGTGQNGTLNPDAELLTQLNDPDVKSIDISTENVSIGSNDKARFDSYYAGILYNLLLLEDSQTVTPLGRRLAAAYDDAISFSFDEVDQAVDDQELPRNLLERISSTGCPCQLSDQERQLLTQAYWYLSSPSIEYDQLAFDESPSPELLELDEFLRIDERQLEEAAREAEFIGVEEAEYEAHSEDLEQFFVEGRHQFVRASLTLLLTTAEWVTARPTASPDFEYQEDAREIYRLLVHAEYASYAIQSLFLAVQGTVRELEPIGPTELLSTLFDAEEFDKTAGEVLDEGELNTNDQESRPVLDGIRDAVYFGEAPTGALQHTVSTSGTASTVSGTWADVQSRLTERDASNGDGPFHLSETSERAYRVALHDELSSADSVQDYRRIAALASVLVARLGTRYEQHFGTKRMEPYRAWFDSAHEDPGPKTCWEITNESTIATQLTGSLRMTDWNGSEFARTAAIFTKQWALVNYFEELFTKIGDSNGRSPQLLHLDSDGRLTFDYAAYDGALYNHGSPNAPTLKWDRLGDIFYELGLATTNSLDSFEPTQTTRELIAQFTDEGEQ